MSIFNRNSIYLDNSRYCYLFFRYNIYRQENVVSWLEVTSHCPWDHLPVTWWASQPSWQHCNIRLAPWQWQYFIKVLIMKIWLNNLIMFPWSKCCFRMSSLIHICGTGSLENILPFFSINRLLGHFLFHLKLIVHWVIFLFHLKLSTRSGIVIWPSHRLLLPIVRWKTLHINIMWGGWGDDSFTAGLRPRLGKLQGIQQNVL